MRIKLSEAASGDYMTFPMLPEEIRVEAGTKFQTYDIMNIGEIKIPQGGPLLRFSWTGKLPGASRQSEPYIIVKKNPIDMQSWWSKLRNEGTKCHLEVICDDNGKEDRIPINHDVYLENYTVRYSGGFGDYDYDISFISAKDLVIHTELPWQEQEEDEPVERPAPETPKTYVVKSGDTLWHIAERFYQDGASYKRIVEANQISNPDLIYPGTELVIP